MTQQAPELGPPGQQQPRAARPLEYATPQPSRYPEFDFIARVTPRVVFALGAALFAGGVGAIFRSEEAVVMMGTGAGLMALVGPAGWRQIWPGREK